MSVKHKGVELKDKLLAGFEAHEKFREEEKVRILYLLCQKYAASNLDAFDREVKRSLHRTGICKIAITEWSAKGKRVNRS